MGAKPDEIKREIETERERLGENLQTLQQQVRHQVQQVKQAADWRTWVDRRPLAALAVAFGAGLWLSTRGH